MNKFAFLLCASLAVNTVLAEEPAKWSDTFCNYRVRLHLSESVSGAREIKIPTSEIIGAMRPLSPDPLDETTFAFERVVVVDPATGQRVGGYVYAQDDTKNALINSEFKMEGNLLPGWSGFDPSSMKIETVQLEGVRAAALFIEKTTYVNSKVSQALRLKPGQWYLQTDWQYRGDSDTPITVQVLDPSKRIFKRDFSSYVPALLPLRQWVKSEAFVLPKKSLAELEISTVFVGRNGVAGLSLRPISWKLMVDLPKESRVLDVYYVGRSGHMLTTAQEAKQLVKVAPSVAVEKVSAESSFPSQVNRLGGDANFSLWSVPSDFPLREDFLKKLSPSADQPIEPLHGRVFRGGAVTFVAVIESKTPLLEIQKAIPKFPFPVRIERLALIPIYDGPHPTGQWQQNRFDALLPIDEAIVPPSTEGLHLLAITIQVPISAKAGTHSGNIQLALSHPKGVTSTFELPISLDVANVAIHPMRHFGTLLGNEQWLSTNSADLTNPTRGAAEFHGLTSARIHETVDDEGRVVPGTDPRETRLGKLLRAYSHRLLDSWIAPQSPALFVPFTYQVREMGDRIAPQVYDFDFVNFDKSLDEFVKDRGMMFFPIQHTNGHLMDSIRLANGVTYTLKPVEESSTVKQLPEEEFFKLIGDYYDAVARHFHEKDMLDRALVTIDESDYTTYDLMLRFRRALQKKPYASKLRFLHTIQKTAAFTQRKPDGGLVLDEVLDIPAPINDEHFNFFQPETTALFKKPKQEMWAYYVETDHWNLTNAGLSTIITPLKLDHFGASGWYCWSGFMWSLPYPVAGPEEYGPRFTSGPVVNPWLNPFYHHGPGVLSFFYPPDPRGIPAGPTDKIVPSFRLYLMRDGIQNVALRKVLAAGQDDEGQVLRVDKVKLAEAGSEIDRLWPGNPVQWYLSYDAYRRGVCLLYDAL